MSDPPDSNRLAKTQQFLTHIGHGDWDQVAGLFAPDVTYHVIGNHALSGSFVGREAVADHLASIYERTAGRFDTVKWDDWMIGQHHVATLVTVQMEANGAVFRGRHLVLVKFDPDDLIDHVTVFFEDVAAIERFYGRTPPRA